MTWRGGIAELDRRRRWALAMGGSESVARQHAAGRMTVRERIDALVDPGSFREIGMLTGRATYDDAGNPRHVMPAPYIGGVATIDGRPVAVGGEDFTVRAGSSPGLARRKGGQGGMIEDIAFEHRIPLINLCHGSGGTVTSARRLGYAPLPGTDGIERPVDLLGRVPVVGAVLGTAAGGPAVRAVLSHWSIMAEGSSHIMVAGPKVVARSLGEETDKDTLGGADTAVDLAGTIHDRAADEAACLARIKRFLSYMPQNVWEQPPMGARDDPPDRAAPELRGAIPDERMRPYDMRRILAAIFDAGSLFELRATYGKAIVTCLARIDGMPVGVVANDPMINGGAVDVAAARKQTQFVDLCDTFHLPLLFFVDSPGFMVGSRAESQAALREGCRCMMATCQATVPMTTVVLRKCYGLGGGIAQSRNGLDHVVAWPSGEWGSLPLAGGVAVAHKNEIESAPDPKAREREIEDELAALASPFRTAEAFGITDILDPADTRPYLARFARLARDSMTHRLGPKAKFGVRP